MKIVLPWPSPALSPNARSGSWHAKARAVKRARADAFLWCKAQGVQKIAAERVTVEITFHPPNARRRDLDNCIASFKAGADAVADAIGVDDSRWRLGYGMGEPVKGGEVVVEILS